MVNTGGRSTVADQLWLYSEVSADAKWRGPLHTCQATEVFGVMNHGP